MNLELLNSFYYYSQSNDGKIGMSINDVFKSCVDLWMAVYNFTLHWVYGTDISDNQKRTKKIYT